ncbi:SpaA isopeptide-forming pilin-related protein [Streptomyces sp. NPDC057580]|uniref:MSCRAMM family protein n=1 Tax=Streptomyces sp. NPDC057580 TaxID=3346173 RepID=UPI0036767F2D
MHPDHGDVDPFKRGELLLKKVDKTTGRPLAGAVITINRDLVDGAGKHTKGKQIAQLTTGKDGTAKLQLDVTLRNGTTYWATETKAPAGYEADAASQRFTAKPGAQATITLADTKTPTAPEQPARHHAAPGRPAAAARPDGSARPHRIRQHDLADRRSRRPGGRRWRRGMGQHPTPPGRHHPQRPVTGRPEGPQHLHPPSGPQAPPAQSRLVVASRPRGGERRRHQGANHGQRQHALPSEQPHPTDPVAGAQVQPRYVGLTPLLVVVRHASS